MVESARQKGSAAGTGQRPVNKPNFFILGAAKSGTTSLYAYLRLHPDVFMSPLKEPTFFCHPFQVVSSPIMYFELFGEAAGARVIGEASHAYLSNPSTPKVLKLLVPDAKFLVILRNPADRAFSLYHHMRRSGFEWIGSFEQALSAEEKRVRSRRFKMRCPQYYYNFLYFRSGLYGEQIERYLNLFDRQQFHFLMLDQLLKDPTSILTGVLAFLNLDANFSPPFEIHNKGDVTARSALVQYLCSTRIPCPRTIRKWGDTVLNKLNMKVVSPLPRATKKALIASYGQDLVKLFQLAGVQFPGAIVDTAGSAESSPFPRN